MNPFNIGFSILKMHIAFNERCSFLGCRKRKEKPNPTSVEKVFYTYQCPS